MHAHMPRDLYDDLRLSTPATKVALNLPDEIWNAELLEPEQRDRLPDRLFAYVEDGTRKFAMHDAAHVVTSLLYFDQCADRLPEAVATKIASRLAEGCSWYGLTPPEQSKVAFLGKAMTALNVVGGAASMRDAAKTGVQKHKAVVGQLGKLASQEMPVAAGTILPPGMPRVAEMGGDATAPISNSVRREETTTPEQERKIQKGEGSSVLQQFLDDTFMKKADLNGTALMPLGATSKQTGARAVAKITATKTSHYALPQYSRYPIETEGQVKAAARYFDEYITAFTPFDRRIYAQSVYDRAEELGVKVSGRLLEYAGLEYGPHIHGELLARARGFEGTGHEVIYNTLAEKIAELEPAVMAQVLRAADVQTGAAESYGRPGVGYLDPWAAVYGGAKLAAEEASEADVSYTWKDETDYTTGLQLIAFAKRGPKPLEFLGGTTGQDFVQNPVRVFKGLKPAQKKLVVRTMNSTAMHGSST